MTEGSGSAPNLADLKYFIVQDIIEHINQKSGYDRVEWSALLSLALPLPLKF